MEKLKTFEQFLNDKNSNLSESRNDFMARHGKTDITIKKGYKHASGDELTQMYDEVGALLKKFNIPVKSVTILTESLNLSEQDHEVKMSSGQLEALINSALDLKEKLGEIEKDIPAWIQDHISQAYNYLKQANDGYHELDESIDTRFRSEIFVNLKRAGFIPDEDFEYMGSQLYAKDMEVAKDIVDELADKYRFSIQDKRITKEGKVPINVGRK